MSTSLFEFYGCAIDTFKIMMNTNIYRNQILKSKIDKSVGFLGSYMVFDPSTEKSLQEFYHDDKGEPTTEGCLVDEIVTGLSKKISSSRKKYMCLTLGSILKTDYVCHHVSLVLKKEKKKLVIKMINSGLYYLSKNYGSVIENVMIKISSVLHLEPVFLYPYIGISWVGLSLWQPCNPQDYCRGGLYGEILAYLDTKAGIHRESYCQTWSMMMLIYETGKMSEKNYSIENNYFNTWPTDKKTLEIMVRQFALEIVRNFEKEIDFDTQFKVEINNAGLKKRTKRLFSSILLESFQNLHPEIE